MQATRHLMLDAYDCNFEQANNIMVVNSLLVTMANKLEMKPVMPPYVLPYYYCEETEDGGISAFIICENGSHITIHTFPYRYCYFVDVLTDKFFIEADVVDLLNRQIYAKTINSNIVDRRIYNGKSNDIDSSDDFGPHYMITAENIDANMESIFKWLDNVAPRINMQAISRPYVIYDKLQNPEYISGVLVVAQSHIAFHYSIKERKANIDIFSCSFLENGAVENLLHDSFGEQTQVNLFARGSKHRIRCEVDSRQAKIKRDEAWRKNIFEE
jgi:S-adenosylmethionine/arginine decarboxylase-like enzyme